ncbi:MAG: branched-chain amino acid aminotransferase [Bacteroidales bacterium]|nr:branched-chain amino acid aminotransferase [Bacteroidales bacterium]
MSEINWDKLGFDAYRTRTVVLSHYKDGKWSPVETTENFSFTLDPFAQVFHYAISCFEGLKTFRQKDGRIAIFRPDQNAARMQRTAKFLGIPAPDKDLFIKMCTLCVQNNLEFLPPYGHQASLYLRPMLFGVHPQMQLVPYPEAYFAVICAPAGSYYGEHLKSFAGVIPGNYDRAAPKGSGSYKIGANYAATFKPYKTAHDQGYTELLYLNSGTREFIDEFGSSNFFAIKGNKYITPLSDSVLPSITNKTLQEVAADFGMEVEKRPVRVEELADFDEAAACGTAVVITPMSHIDIKPLLEEDKVEKSYRFMPDGEVGEVCTKLYKRITGIQFGELEDTHGWCYHIEEK